MTKVEKALRRPIANVFSPARKWRLARLFRKYQPFTMIPEGTYVDNLLLARSIREVSGCVVECGVWRGGMIAGIAEVLGPSRRYYLVDSFEGLPPAQQIDGPAALKWQANKTHPMYLNNCTASEAEAENAMKLSQCSRFTIVKGWFHDILPNLDLPEGIALLRLDADWYHSTRDCLQNLVPRLNPGGIIIVDDYYTWDGCTTAVHEFLANCSAGFRMKQFGNNVCVLERCSQSG
jgi:O-methyltransferase